MGLKQFGIYLLIAASAALFIRASIVPLFVTYGDSFDEMYMSIFSLAFVLLAFVLIVKRGSFPVGIVLTSIGAFYIYNGYRILGFVLRDAEYIPYSEGMINANIMTMTFGAVILGCGIFALLLRRRTIHRKDANVRASV